VKRRPLAGFAVLLAVACAGAGGSVDFPPEHRDTAARMLRLTDVPGVYLVDSDTGCGIGVENAPPELARLIIAHLPGACAAYLHHRRKLRSILADVFVFRSPDAAAALFAARRDLFRYSTGLERFTEHPHVGFGDEARLFTSPDARLSGPDLRRPGAAVFWRRGAMLGSVLVTQESPRRALGLARRLAAVQDGRMRNPTPIRAGDYDDLEVPLGDPSLRVPVRWLGRSFAPGGGLPPLRLEYTYGPDHPQDGLPSPRARMEYESARPRTYGIDLELWRPPHWRTFERARLGRLVLGARCSRVARVLRVRGGRAVVYASYARTPRRGRCPKRRPDLFIARVSFRRVVAVFNMPQCINCGEGVTGRSDPYNSVRGMATVVRGLRPRTQSS
jgi:hypothetical protein